MAKKIKFTYKDRDYVLEFNRNSVRALEAQGFQVEKIDAQPDTMISLLFAGAFLMHHRNAATNRKLVEEIFRNIPKRGELVETLVEMYQEPLLALFDEPEETEGNLKWETED